MLGDGLEVTIRYREGNTLLTNRKCITLQDLKCFQDTDKMLNLVTRQLWADIEWELRCQKLL